MGFVKSFEAGSIEAVAPPGLLLRLTTHTTALLRRTGVSPVILRGAAWSISGNVAGAAASFLTQAILARTLAATRYGVYSYLLAWVNLAVLFGKLELDTAALRFIGAYDGARRDGLLRGFLRYGWRTVGSAAIGVALLGGTVAWLLRARLPAGTAGGIWAAALLMPLSASLAFSSSALQGLRRVPQAQLPQLLLRPVLFGVAILISAVGLGVELSAGGVVALNAAATAVALGVSLALLARAVPPRVVAAEPAFDRPQWMGAVRGLMIIALAQLVLSHQTDVLVVGTLLGPRDAGLYSAASQLSSIIGLGANGVFFVVLPVFSDLYARSRHDELQRLVVRTVQGCTAVTVPVAALLCVAGPAVLHWYGPSFAGAAPVLFVLVAGQLAGLTVGGLSGFLLIMSGHEREASRVAVGTALLNLALAVLLTPLLGMVGAALATVAAGFTRVGLLYWYARRTVGVAVLPYLPAALREAPGA